MASKSVFALMASVSLLGMSTVAHAEDVPSKNVVRPDAISPDDQQTEQTTSPAEANGIQNSDIIITAQRRSESIQNVPIAVSAFNEQLLKAARLDSAGNLALSVPNLNFSQQLYGASNFQIRGIGYSLVTTAGDQGVGVAENYAPIDRARLPDSEFYDVERVEVLRGPQGTLYGRNATGGVINILTNKPVFNDYSASITSEIGNFDAARGKGYINISPRDDIALRVAAYGFRRDGTRYNTYTGNDIDGRGIWSTRATLAIKPSESFRIYGMWEHFMEKDSRMGGARTVCLQDPGPSSVGGVTVNSANARAYLSEGCQKVSIYAPGVLQGVSNSSSSLSGQLTNLIGLTTGNVNAGTVLPNDPFGFVMARDPRSRTVNNNYQLNIEWDIVPGLKLASLTNRNIDTVLQTGAQAPATTPFNTTSAVAPGGVFTDPQIGPSRYLTVLTYNDLRQKQWSQELRLQSSFDGAFNFNLGAFYFNTNRISNVYFFANGQTAYVRTAVPSAYVDPNPIPDGTGHNYYLSASTYTLDSYAAFGEVYVKPTSTLQITAGLRYTDDTKRSPYNPLQLFAPGRGPLAGFPQELQFKEVTGRGSIDWHPTPQTLIYGSYSRGYKGGGFNPPDLAAKAANSYAPEFVDAFEIGTKNSLFNRTLTLNLTGFYYKYNNFQYTVSTGLSTATRNINTELYGLELETVWRPTTAITLNGNVGYLHTEIKPGPNNLSIDPFNITGGDTTLMALKNTSIACVGSIAAVANIVAMINAGTLPASALVGACPTAAAPNGPLAALGLVTNFGKATNITGNKLPTSPEWSVSVGAQYRATLANNWTLTPRADYHYQSSVEGDVYNNPNNRAKGWSNVNATLTLASDEEGWELQAFTRNLFDSKAITAVGVNGASLGLTRQVYYLDPRTYGLSATKRF